MKFDPKQGTLLEVFINDVGLYLIKVMKPGAFAVVFSKDFLIKLAKAIYIPSINA